MARQNLQDFPLASQSSEYPLTTFSRGILDFTAALNLPLDGNPPLKPTEDEEVHWSESHRNHRSALHHRSRGGTVTTRDHAKLAAALSEGRGDVTLRVYWEYWTTQQNSVFESHFSDKTALRKRNTLLDKVRAAAAPRYVIRVERKLDFVYVLEGDNHLWSIEELVEHLKVQATEKELQKQFWEDFKLELLTKRRPE